MIIFDRVWFKYNSEYVLKNINTKIVPGEIICILGDNGAGKTTLIKHMNGLLKPTKGRVLVSGKDTRDTPVSELARKVAIVFQYPEKMFFTKSVYEEVEFALKNFDFEDHVIKHRVKKVLNMFWLWEYKDRSPYTLSGGEQRRLAIAVALAWNPDYIILDEPTAGQDAFQREILINIFRELANQGKTVVLATHDIEFVFELACRTIVLNKGEIIYDGPSEALFNRYSHLLHEAGLDLPVLPKTAKYLRYKGISIAFKNYADALEKIYTILKRGSYFA